MNYLRLFESAVGLFPKTIRVTLVDAVTGQKLTTHKIPAEQLPVAFTRPVILELGNIRWRIFKASPVLADDFLFTKKLTLYVQEGVFIDDRLQQFSVPTICAETPLTGPEYLYHDFSLGLTQEDWRQIEFLPLSLSPVIIEEIRAVEEVLAGQPDALLGYQHQYKRSLTAEVPLNLSWEALLSVLHKPVLGNIIMASHGYIQQGFALQTDSFTYYGILANGLVKTLSMNRFDGVDDELMQVLQNFQLILVDWCYASTISGEEGDPPKQEYIKL